MRKWEGGMRNLKREGEEAGKPGRRKWEGRMGRGEVEKMIGWEAMMLGSWEGVKV
jgi:hypothetical protein